MEMNGGSAASYLARTPCVPVYLQILIINRSGSKGSEKAFVSRERVSGFPENQERKSSPKSKFWGWISHGRPRGYPGGRPGAKASVRSSKSWKTSILVRTSMTRRRTSMTPEGF